MVVGENDRAVLEGHEILEKVDTLFVHSHYNPSQYFNDIAVIKLGNPVPAYTEYVRPVCLPSSNDSYDGLICTITGWGAAYSGEYLLTYTCICMGPTLGPVVIVLILQGVTTT